MTVPIRPPVWPPAPSGLPPGQNDARLTAQKAFFHAARSGQAAAAIPAPNVAPAASAVSPTADGPAADKPLRPGSLLDIRV